MTVPHPTSNTYQKHIPNAGTGLFASKDFGLGELISYIERPLVAVPDSPHLNDTCSTCFRWCPEGQEQEGDDSVKLKACTGCKVVRYCGKDCQSLSWSHHHKHECRIFANLHPKVLPNTVRMVIQLLLRRKAFSLPETDWQQFLALQSHINDFKSQRTTNEENLTTWQTIELMSQAAHSYSGTKETMDRVQAMIARILINTLTLTTPTHDPLGLYLSLPTSHLNHSCRPTTTLVFSGPSLSLRSILPVKKDSEVTITYIDHTLPHPTRLSELSSRYFFTCICPDCKSLTTCNLPSTPPSLLAHISPQNLETLEKEITHLLLQSKAAPTPITAAPLLAKALSLFPHPHYPLHRQPYPSLLHQATLNAIAVGDYALALTRALQAYFHIDPVHYPLPTHPVRVVHKWVLFKLVMQVAHLEGEGEEPLKKSVDWAVVGWGLLREVGEGVGRSHGVESAFAREVGGVADREGWRGVEIPTWRLEEEWRKLRGMADVGM